MEKKIRVLECIRQGQIGGGETHLLSLIENIDRSKFEIVVLSFTDGPMVDRLNEMGIDTNVIYTERPFDWRKWKQVKQLIKQKKIDLIHCHGTRAASNLISSARSLGIPLVYTVHGWSFHADQHPLVRFIRILGEKYLTGKSNLNISVSESNQKSGKKYIRNFDSVVVNNGIDLNKFNPEKQYKNIRSELGVSEKEVMILFIARFTLQKQPLVLIRAFKDAKEVYPGMRLLMVGEGEQRKSAIALIRELQLEDSVSLLPFRQDVPDLLKAADIFVLPSLWEGLPIGLLEAMAMGKAVIGTQVDGTSEVVKAGINGLLVNPGDVTALSGVLVELCRDSESRQKLGQAAQKDVSASFNASQMSRKIEDLYTTLMHKQAG